MTCIDNEFPVEILLHKLLSQVNLKQKTDIYHGFREVIKSATNRSLRSEL